MTGGVSPVGRGIFNTKEQIMEPLKFFRKRTGRIVKFNPEKIEFAINRAIDEARSIWTGGIDMFTARWLRDKVVDLLNDEHSPFFVKPDTIGSRVPKLEEVQDAVEYVIRTPWADAPVLYTPAFAKLLYSLYSNYRKEREKARASLKVLNNASEKIDVTDKGMLLQENSRKTVNGWDRNRLEKDLEDLMIDNETVSSIAKRVERAILKSGLRTVSSDLIVELVNNELTTEGIQTRMNSGRGYFIDKEFVDGLVESKSNENSNIVNNNPEAINLAISGYVMKKWAMDNVFSKDVVQNHSFGFIYVHDFADACKVYCSSHSIEYLKKYGLNKLLNLNTVSKPANSASVLTGHLNTFLASMQAYYAGALGLGYINVFYAPLLRGKSDKELHQIAQELVFNGSQNAFSRGGQTLFLDFNIHTGVPKNFLDVPAIGAGGKYLFQWKEPVFIQPLREEAKENGEKWYYVGQPGWGQAENILVMKDFGDHRETIPTIEGHVMTYADFEPEAQSFCKALLTVWGEGDANGHVFEFPKCDFHVSEESFRDPKQHELFDYACQIAAKNGSVYFVFDRDSITTAACCFTGDTPVLVRGGLTPVTKKATFEELWGMPFNTIKQHMSVYHNGGWSVAKLLRLSGEGKRIFKITTVNKKVQKVTEDHIVPTLDGDKNARDVTVDDYILFSNATLHSLKPNKSRPKSTLTYEQGVLIGAYLGDGSIEYHKKAVTPYIHFSLNEEKYDRLLPLLNKAASEWGLEKEFSLHTPYDNVYPVFMASKELHDIIRKWVSGSYSYEKSLNISCLEETASFRRGILDGMYMTDGGNSNRIYSTSTRLISDLEALCTSLGIQTIIDVSDRTGEGKVVIRGEEFNRNFPVYCIRWYDNGSRRQYPSVFRTKNNSIYYKVASIEELPSEEYVYCFEIIDNNEPYFTLPNGVITHNCRLKIKLDEKTFKYPESMHSCGFQNITINIPQCSYRTNIEAGQGDPEIGSETWNLFISQIDKGMDLAVKAHLQKKKHIARMMSGPGMPLWQVGMPSCDGKPYIDLEKCVYIIGLIGLDDACRYLFGKSMYEGEKLTTWGLSVIAHMNLKVKEYTEKHGITFSLEESPAESAARKLARSDLAHFPKQAKAIVHGAEDAEYYTNSVHIPADAPVALVERIIRQAMFHGMIDSGAITHAFIGEETPSAGAIAHVVELAFRLTQSAQITFSPEFTYCLDCGHGERGLKDRCTACGSGNVVGETRVVGYFSRIQNWNKSKRYGELVARHKGRYGVETAGEDAK